MCWKSRIPGGSEKVTVQEYPTFGIIRAYPDIWKQKRYYSYLVPEGPENQLSYTSSLAVLTCLRIKKNLYCT